MRKVFGAALAAAIAVSAGAVEVREEILHCRLDRDRWTLSNGGSASYGNGGVLFVLGSKRGETPLRGDSKMPGAVRLPGAKAFVVRTDRGFPGGRVRMLLRREVRTREKPEPIEFSAPWERETAIRTDLPETNHYYLVSFGFSAQVPSNTVVTLLGVDAITEERKEEALRMDVVSSGNAFRSVRYGLGEKAFLTFCNPTAEPGSWKGTLTAKDFFGRTVDIPYAVTLPPGGESRQELPQFPAKGIWRMSNTLRLAVLDAHETTPLQPEDEFRIGTIYHVDRYTKADNEISMDALNAIGAKIIRADYWPARTQDGWDFAREGRITDELLRRGIAVNAIFRTDGREFGEAAARYFGTRLSYYEYGNEWDLKFKHPYDKMVGKFRAFSEGVRSACPQAKVIMGGFAAESSTKLPSSKIRKDFQERFMMECRDLYAVHAIHLHSHYEEYVGKLKHFFKWRKDCGIDDKPWFANETAVTVTRVGEDPAAVILWQKILYSWSRGSVDYLWYNLRGTGYKPFDSEQGYGMMTADFRPRATFAAFSALTKVFFRLESDGVLHDGKGRQVMRWKGTRHGKPCRVIAGWDALAGEKGCAIRIRTDATKAAQVDLMGNVFVLPIRNGIAEWTIGKVPTAVVFVDGKRAEPDARDLRAEAVEPVKIIHPGKVGEERPPDLVLRNPDQVYEIYEAKPEYRHRTWRWFGDLRAEVRFFRCAADRVSVLVTVEDDVHSPVPGKPLEGDACVLKIGGRDVVLVSDERAHGSTTYRHEFVLPAGGRPVPFNVRIYENDGEGPDGWIEYRPFEGPTKVEVCAE